MCNYFCIFKEIQNIDLITDDSTDVWKLLLQIFISFLLLNGLMSPDTCGAPAWSFLPCVCVRTRLAGCV